MRMVRTVVFLGSLAATVQCLTERKTCNAEDRCVVVLDDPCDECWKRDRFAEHWAEGDEIFAMLQVKASVQQGQHIAGDGLDGARSDVKYPRLIAATGKMAEDLVKAGAAAAAVAANNSPASVFANGIPKILHFTWKSADDLSSDHTQTIARWQELNPDFKCLFWSDDDVVDFIHRYAPLEHQAMISAMKFNITLFDYFRYLVVYRVGGVYTDIDVSPIVPIEQWASEHAALASLITGWEVRLPKTMDLSNTSYVRHDQLQQWTITAAPMHPALLSTMQHIADNFNSGNVDNPLSYTGPGPWTDGVLAYTGQPSERAGFGEGAPNDNFLRDVVIHRKDRMSLSSQDLTMNQVGLRCDAYLVHHFQNSWMDEWRGRLCLAEALSPEECNGIHREATNLMID